MKYYILTFILAFLLSGCSVMEGSGDGCPGQQEDEAGLVTLNFKLISSSIGASRADNEHEEPDSEWAAFENLIDAKDFAFFIFCKQEDNTWSLVFKMTDITYSNNAAMIAGSPGFYTVTAKINKEQLGHTVTSGSNNLLYFRMVVLANTGASKDEYDGLDTSSFDDLIGAASKMTINLNSIYQSASTSNSVKDLYNGAIPMFGLRSFVISEGQLYASRPEERIWIGDISMLRSLAKIRVIDNIKNRNNATGLPRIETVTFEGSTFTSNVLPPDPAKYQDGYQIETPNPSSSNEGLIPIRLGYLNSENKTTLLGYIPEQSISQNPALPTLNIAVTLEVDAEGKPSRQKTYNVPMFGYNDEEFAFGDAILRNHIYTLEVSEIIQLKFKVSIKKWEPGGWADIQMAEVIE